MERFPDDIDTFEFFGHTIHVSIKTLLEKFGEPQYYGKGKVRKRWTLECKDGTVCTLYDWKMEGTMYKSRKYEFHIGASTRLESFKSYLELQKFLW